MPRHLRQIILMITVLFAARLNAEEQQSARDVPIKHRLVPATDTTVITEPLLEDGRPAFHLALNQELMAKVPIEDNFWAKLWIGLGALDGIRPAYSEKVEKILLISIPREYRLKAFEEINPEATRSFEISNEPAKTTTTLWTREAFPRVASWLDANEEVLTIAAEAAESKKAFAPLIQSEENDTVVELLLPHVQAVRRLTELFASRAMLRTSERDFQGAWRDILTIHRLARHIDEGDTGLERMVAAETRSRGMHSLQLWLSKSDLDANALEQKYNEIRSSLVIRPIASTLRVQRLMWIDSVISSVVGKANLAVLFGDRHAPNAELLVRYIRTSADINGILRCGNRLHDEIADSFAQTSRSMRVERLSLIQDQVKESAQSVKTRFNTVVLFTKEDPENGCTNYLMLHLSTDYLRIEQAHTRAQARAVLVDSAIRLEIARRRSGKMPSSWKELDPDRDTPIDPFNGQPLGLLVLRSSAGIWSVGPNERDDLDKRNATGDDDIGIKIDWKQR
jgi:hypothetical protein